MLSLLQSKKLPVLKHIKDSIGRVNTFKPLSRMTQNTSISRKYIREGHTAGDPSAPSMMCPICAAMGVESRQGTEQKQSLHFRHWIDITKETAICKANCMCNCSQTGDSNMTILKARLHP